MSRFPLSYVKMFAVVALVTLSACLPALAQTTEQKNVVVSSAILAVANKWCKNYLIDMEAVGRIVANVVGNIEKEPFRSMYLREIADTQAAFNEAGADAACETVYQTYGPPSQFGSAFIVKR